MSSTTTAPKTTAKRAYPQFGPSVRIERHTAGTDEVQRVQYRDAAATLTADQFDMVYRVQDGALLAMVGFNGTRYVTTAYITGAYGMK